MYVKAAFGMVFKVFSVAWYLQRDKAATDSTLAAFRETNNEDMAASNTFFDALASPLASYDRSLLVTMAMDVKKDLLLAGLVQELDLKPENSALLASAGLLFKSATCERGLGKDFTLFIF